ncbi:hypothetical protein KAU37_09710 [Candidatus Bipolaricaulota bacterium]|nr:hypothetical protein [Candidatus Bipolaricaulota bacterium]
MRRREGYITIKDLQRQHSDISYQRLNRAVGCLRKAGLISPWRGRNNELQMSPGHALLVERLVQLMRRDYGVKKAVTFLDAQVAKERVEKMQDSVERLVSGNPDLEEKCRAVGLLGEPKVGKK